LIGGNGISLLLVICQILNNLDSIVIILEIVYSPQSQKENTLRKSAD